MSTHLPILSVSSIASTLQIPKLSSLKHLGTLLTSYPQHPKEHATPLQKQCNNYKKYLFLRTFSLTSHLNARKIVFLGYTFKRVRRKATRINFTDEFSRKIYGIIKAV